MGKNSPEKPGDGKRDILSDIQEKAKRDLAALMTSSHLLDSVREYQESLEQFRKTIDFQGMSERMTLPLKQFSNISEQIKALSQSFQVTIPSGLLETINNAKYYYPEKMTTVYRPRPAKSIADVELGLTKFMQKVENKIEELAKAIDKNNASDKIKLVSEKNVYCGHCDYLLMKVQFTVYGKATMKCPQCKKVIHIPEELRYKELK